MFFIRVSLFAGIAGAAEKCDFKAINSSIAKVGAENLSDKYVLGGKHAESEPLLTCLDEDKSNATSNATRYSDDWYVNATADGGWIKKLMTKDRKGCIKLTQSDFVLSAKVKEPLTITASNSCYVLMEDVTVDFGRVDKLRNSDTPVHHGFNYAVRILADDVLFDMQGHSIKMTPSYFNFQPFLSIFDLAEFPFPGSRSWFDPITKFANRVIIHNGTVGLSTHFGIHGNENKGLVISHVKVENFAVAGIMFNGASDVSVENCTLHNTNFKAEVDVQFGFLLQTMRRAQFLNTDRANGFKKECTSSVENHNYDKMRSYIGKLITQVLADKEVAKRLEKPELHMKNTGGLPQGNVFGIYFAQDHNVHKYGTERALGIASNLRIVDVKVHNLKKGSDEAKTVWFGDNLDAGENKLTERMHWKDFFGHRGDYSAICDDNDNLRKNDWRRRLAIARLVFADCTVLKEEHDRPQEYEAWYDSILTNLEGQGDGSFNVSTGTSCKQLTKNAGLRPKSGVDVAGHSTKGVIGIRVDQIVNLKIDRVSVEKLHNKAALGMPTVVGENTYTDSPPVWKSSNHTAFVYKGNFAYGITVSGCSNVDVRNSRVADLQSDTGSVFGLLMQGENANVTVHAVEVENLEEGTTLDSTARSALKLPNMVPVSLPIFVDFTRKKGLARAEFNISATKPKFFHGFSGSDCDVNNSVDATCVELNEVRCGSKTPSCARGNVQDDSEGRSVIFWLFVIGGAVLLIILVVDGVLVYRRRQQKALAIHSQQPADKKTSLNNGSLDLHDGRRGGLGSGYRRSKKDQPDERDRSKKDQPNERDRSKKDRPDERDRSKKDQPDERNRRSKKDQPDERDRRSKKYQPDERDRRSKKDQPDERDRHSKKYRPDERDRRSKKGRLDRRSEKDRGQDDSRPESPGRKDRSKSRKTRR